MIDRITAGSKHRKTRFIYGFVSEGITNWVHGLFYDNNPTIYLEKIFSVLMFFRNFAMFLEFLCWRTMKFVIHYERFKHAFFVLNQLRFCLFVLIF